MPRPNQNRTDWTLPPRVRSALGWGARAALLALLAVTGLALDSPLGVAFDLLVGLLLGLALLGLGAGILEALRWLSTRAAATVGDGVLLATLGALAFLALFAGLPLPMAAAIWGLWLLAFAALVVGVVVAVAPGRSAEAAPPPWARVAAPVAGVAVFATLALWWWSPAERAATAPSAILGAGTAADAVVAQPPLADPGAAGPHDVATFTYGSGVPRWRQAYGANARWSTTPVPLDDLVSVSGAIAAVRARVLGHGLDAVPRNATVWHPAQGDGPHPLVIVAHGNANMLTPSELGYAWLGQHLASHGYVVASIDASALNTLPLLGQAGALRGENDARALLMLSHLQLWQAWQEAGHPVAAGVDVERVILVGHSRGGEAAAIAAAFDRLGRRPADATSTVAERVGGPYAIRAVVAFAPSDGQYRVGDRGTVLEGVDYLVLQGGHDADVTSFQGERQYERTTVPDGGFKAAVYLHEANHGQFNTHWGRADAVPPLDALLRTAEIVPGDDQRRVAAALVTAFLEATVRGERGYLTAFTDAETAAAWLPRVTTVVRYDDGAGVTLAGFQEDVDPTTGTLPGVTAMGDALVVWREGDPRYRAGVERRANAVTLGWRDADEATTPAYRLAWPEHVDLGLHAGSAVRLEVARGTAPFPLGTTQPIAPLDAHVVLSDAEGRRAAVPLSADAGVPPDLPVRLARAPVFALPRFLPERQAVYATVELPLHAFLESEPDLDLGSLRTLALEFDLVPAGVLTVRSIGVVPRTSDAR